MALPILLAACVVVQAAPGSVSTSERGPGHPTVDARDAEVDLAERACDRARSLFDAGRWAEAEVEARRVVADFPTSARGRILLGVVRSANGARPSELVETFTHACRLDPKSFEARLLLGRALLRAGRDDDALAALEQAVRLDASRVDGHYQLALALRRAGRAADAAREFAIVDRLNQASRAMTNGMGGPTPPH